MIDLARAHVLALRALEEGRAAPAYNLGTGHGHTAREVVEACRKASGRAIRAVEATRRAGDPAALVVAPSPAKGDLGRSRSSQRSARSSRSPGGG